MSYGKQAPLGDRLKAAAKAREDMLARFKARPASDDPEVQAQQAARLAVSRARQERLSAREAERRAERERRAAEAEAETIRLAAEREREAAEAIRRKEELEAEQKQQRDARYAARKSRTGR